MAEDDHTVLVLHTGRRASAPQALATPVQVAEREAARAVVMERIQVAQNRIAALSQSLVPDLLPQERRRIVRRRATARLELSVLQGRLLALPSLSTTITTAED